MKGTQIGKEEVKQFAHFCIYLCMQKILKNPPKTIKANKPVQQGAMQDPYTKNSGVSIHYQGTI